MCKNKYRHKNLISCLTQRQIFVLPRAFFLQSSKCQPLNVKIWAHMNAMPTKNMIFIYKVYIFTCLAPLYIHNLKYFLEENCLTELSLGEDQNRIHIFGSSNTNLFEIFLIEERQLTLSDLPYILILDHIDSQKEHFKPSTFWLLKQVLQVKRTVSRL